MKFSAGTRRGCQVPREEAVLSPAVRLTRPRRCVPQRRVAGSRSVLTLKSMSSATVDTVRTYRLILVAFTASRLYRTPDQLISSLMRFARPSMAKGFVRIAIPGSSPVGPIAAFSA